MKTITTSHLYAISEITTRADDWKKALDEMVQLVRSILIFDNLAVYLQDPQKNHLDVMYARALGRGKKAEADSAWGEIIATQVVEESHIILEAPQKAKNGDRLQQPFLLGIPLIINSHCLGALVLVRFGGPVFAASHRRLANLIARQIALLIERQNLQRDYELVIARHQQAMLQEDFISTISHELRNPLGFIKGYTTTLLRTDATWDPSTQLDFLRIIDRETDHLQGLIENLLDSSRLQTGQMRMRFQPVYIETGIRELVARLKTHEPSLSVSIEVEGNPVPIEADSYRLLQVFENLLINAIKYASGSVIIVKIKQDQFNTTIAFQDFGPGIPEKYLPYIFDRFFRNPDLSPNIRGTGLGLYICRQLIQAHQGQISVTSEEGQGSTFQIILPNIRPGV